MDEEINYEVDVPPKIISEKEYLKRNSNMLVVRSRVIEKYKKLGYRTTIKTLDMIDYMVARIIKDSCRRCKGNNRATILHRDI